MPSRSRVSRIGPGHEGGAAPRTARVLIVAHAFPPAFRGGSIRTLQHLTARLGHEFEFFVLTRCVDYGESTRLDVPVGTWTGHGGAQVRYEPAWRRTPRRIARLAREVEADVLFVNSLFAAGSVAACVARRLGLLRLPLVVAPEGELDPVALAHHRRRKLVFLRVARVLGLHRRAHWRAASTGEVDDILEYAGLDAEVTVAQSPPPPPAAAPPVAAEGSATPPAAAPPTATAPAGGPTHHGPRLAYLSIVSARKGPTRAARLVLATADATLDVFGPSRDDRELAALLAVAADSGGRIRYHGALEHDDVDRTLGAYDALILPTQGEIFGYVIGEALLAGCPVIVSDRTPWLDLDEYGAGRVVPLDDERAWRAALEELRSIDPDERRRRRDAALTRGERWARETTADDQWRALLRSAVGVANVGGHTAE